MPRVLNVKEGRPQGAVYCGRGGKVVFTNSSGREWLLGNPYVIGFGGSPPLRKRIYFWHLGTPGGGIPPRSAVSNIQVGVAMARQGRTKAQEVFPPKVLP